MKCNKVFNKSRELWEKEFKPYSQKMFIVLVVLMVLTCASDSILRFVFLILWFVFLITLIYSYIKRVLALQLFEREFLVIEGYILSRGELLKYFDDRFGNSDKISSSAQSYMHIADSMNYNTRLDKDIIYEIAFLSAVKDRSVIEDIVLFSNSNSSSNVPIKVFYTDSTKDCMVASIEVVSSNNQEVNS